MAEININTLFKILDKHKDKEKQTIFIDTEDMEERYGTQLYIEYLGKYKNAWEELKSGFEKREEGWLNREDQSYMVSRFEKLEKKHKIEVSNEN